MCLFQKRTFIKYFSLKEYSNNNDFIIEYKDRKVDPNTLL